MTQPLRIFLSIVISLVALVGGVSILLVVSPNTNPKIAAFAAVAAGFAAYRLIKPKPKPTKVEVFWEMSRDENGIKPAKIVKERGYTMNGIREGEWDFFNESGEYIKSVNYKDGELIS